MDLTKMFGIKDLIGGMQLRAACGCHQGKKRNNNEDNLYFDGSYMNSDNHGLPEPYYYSTANSSGEIDFLLQGRTSIIPLEVKAEENLRAKSLKAFCEKYKPKYAVRTSMSDYREQEWMTNIPLYNIDRIKEYLEQ